MKYLFLFLLSWITGHKLDMNFTSFTIVIIFSSICLFSSQPAFSQRLTQPGIEAPADDPSAVQGLRNRSGYGDVPQFGGPGSVGSQLKEDDLSKKPFKRFKIIDDFLTPWFEFKKKVDDKIGLAFGTDYTAIYQVVSVSPGEHDAAGGIWRAFGTLTLFGKESGNTGAVISKIEHRHKLGTEIVPQSLGFEVGYNGLVASPYSDSEWGLTNLYWQQKLFSGKLSFIAGIIDVTDYLDVYGLINPWTHFSNLQFSTNPTIPAPNQGMGAALGAMITDNIYMIGSIADTNGDPTNQDDSIDSFFDDNEYFTHFEIGLVSSFERRYFDNVHITIWHADERKAAGTPDDWGIAFSAAKFIGDSVMPFFRAGYADDITALLEATIATGIGYFKQNNSDLFAIGFAWGRPADNSLDDQYTVEMFYRLQLSQNIAISPDIQLLINPALNPDEDIIAVFGLRGRVAL